MLLRSTPVNTHVRPVHLKPATDVRPTKVGKNQNAPPFLSHTNVLRNKQPAIAPGSMANAAAAGCGGMNCGGGEEGGRCVPWGPKGGVKAIRFHSLIRRLGLIRPIIMKWRVN